MLARQRQQMMLHHPAVGAQPGAVSGRRAAAAGLTADIEEAPEVVPVAG